MNTISLLSQFTAVLFTIVLIIQIGIRQDRQRYSNKLLLAFLITSSYAVILFMIESNGYFEEFWFLYKTAMPSSLIIPGLAYLYIRSVILDEQRFRKFDWIHFVPFIIGLIQYLPYYLSSSDFKIQTVQGLLIQSNLDQTIGIVSEPVIFIFRMSIILFYLLLIPKILLKTFDADKENRFSKKLTSEVKRWVRVFGFSYWINNVTIILYYLVLLNPKIYDFSSNVSEYGDPLIITLFNSTMVFYSAYLLIKPDILLGMHSMKIDGNGVFKKSGLNQDQIESCFKDVYSHIKNERLYQNSNFRIQDLAVRLNYSIRDISLAINLCYDNNFNQLVNDFRIEECILKLKDGYLDNFTLESLAKECGFSSRSTFFNSFKLKTGITPKQFLESLESFNQ